MSEDDILEILYKPEHISVIYGTDDKTIIQFARAIEAKAVAKEREACAALAESQRDSEEYGHAKAACSHIVEAIRARGE